jgi:hypothetical protein
MGIEQFEILKTLGEGAFASVHKVRASIARCLPPPRISSAFEAAYDSVCLQGLPSPPAMPLPPLPFLLFTHPPSLSSCLPSLCR